MRCFCHSLRRAPGRVRTRSENPEKPGGADGANPGEAGGAHDDPMRDDAVDGEELMILRVPRIPPEHSARQIAEHELTGHAVYRSWCRHCVASSTHSRFPRGRRVARNRHRLWVLWKCQMPKEVNRVFGSGSCLESRVRLCEFVFGCIHREFGVQKGSW